MDVVVLIEDDGHFNRGNGHGNDRGNGRGNGNGRGCGRFNRRNSFW